MTKIDPPDTKGTALATHFSEFSLDRFFSNKAALDHHRQNISCFNHDEKHAPKICTINTRVKVQERRKNIHEPLRDGLHLIKYEQAFCAVRDVSLYPVLQRFLQKRKKTEHPL
jgi:hypothetical protein